MCRAMLFATLFLTFGFSAWSSTKNKLVVHEWGTFTSYSGSDGQLQSGLHHEEEPLPNFVYGVGASQENGVARGDERPCRPSKIPCDLAERLEGQSLPQNPLRKGITQKMETPVIYFYGEEGSTVNVDIGFPMGVISQYYPRAFNYTPKLSQVQSIGPSQFKFKVDLLSPLAGGLPQTQSDSIWNAAREVPEANTLAVDHEREKFIFYRGVGNLETNIKVIESSATELEITNHSRQPIRGALILNSNGQRGAFTQVGSFSRSAKVEIPDYVNEGFSYAQYLQKVRDILKVQLIEAGLFEKEALSMINTWEKSYFQSPGLRVLYVVPDIEVSRILPLKVTPTPDQLTRVLVGRIEVLTKSEEQSIASMLASESFTTGKAYTELGRFYEPKIRRIHQLVTQESESPRRQRILQNIGTLLTHTP